MSENQTRTIVKAYLTAFNASDSDAMLSLMHEDVAHDINQGDRQIGKENFRRFNAERTRHYREEFTDIIVMVAEGGVRAAAEFTIRGSYIATTEGMPDAHGQAYDLSGGIFFDVDDGLITRISSHHNLRDLIAQIS